MLVTIQVFCHYLFALCFSEYLKQHKLGCFITHAVGVGRCNYLSQNGLNYGIFCHKVGLNWELVGDMRDAIWGDCYSNEKGIAVNTHQILVRQSMAASVSGIRQCRIPGLGVRLSLGMKPIRLCICMSI